MSGGRPPKSGVKMRLPPAEGNKLEQVFGLRLFSMRQRGEIRQFAYEPVKLRLAKGCFYTPDFMVVENDGTITVYEVKDWRSGSKKHPLKKLKGFWREDARIKLKVAARLFPMLRFMAATKDPGLGWVFESIGPKPTQVGK